MIIVELKGGHSNQLFQYAAGRSLSHQWGVNLLMDVDWFDSIDHGDTPRFYELGDYCFRQEFINRQKIALVEDKPASSKDRIYDLTKGHFKPRIKHYLEQSHGFNKDFFKVSDNTYLSGFWQNENYFKDIRPILLKELELKNQPSAKNARYLHQIKSSNSVSVHVRRGDYIDNPAANKFHGVMSVDYYEAALKELVKKTSQKDFTLFIFSNDIAWCKQNLNFDYPMVFVEGNQKGAEDMRLMKHCKHNIMANSSFSWWGAWLNQNPDKFIIAPKVWFQDKEANKQTGIIPADWTRI